MGSRSVTAALCVAVLSAGAAGYCYTQAAELQSQARWLMERGNAQALDYAERLDNAVADAQLKTFAERRTVMERAHLWQRGQMLGLMAGVLAALAAYMLHLLRRLDSQLDDASVEAPPELLTAPVVSSKAEPASRLVPTPHR